jgi:hypothetical protein
VIIGDDRSAHSAPSGKGKVREARQIIEWEGTVLIPVCGTMHVHPGAAIQLCPAAIGFSRISGESDADEDRLI